MLSNFFPLILFEFALVANFSVFGKRGIVWPPYKAKPKLAATVAIIAFVALPFFAAQWLFRSEVHDVSVPWTVMFDLVGGPALDRASFV